MIDQMKLKIEKINLPKGFSVKPVLIHVNGVQRSVVDSNYFTKIIDFGEIFTQDSVPYYDKGLGVKKSAAL